jgi:hypothetical protein
MENKKVYTAPEIELVILDNEISLALESVMPPAGPDEGALLIRMDSDINNPFKSNFA